MRFPTSRSGPETLFRLLTIASVVLQYSFGHDDDLLGNPVRAATLRAHLSELLLGVKFNQHFPWIVDTLELLPMALAKHIMPPGVLDMKEFSTVSSHISWSITC